MNIYIAYNYEDEPISVLLADNKEKAHIAWAGMNDQPHRVEEIDPNSDLGVYGVAFLLTSQEKEGRICERFRKWKRGL